MVVNKNSDNLDLAVEYMRRLTSPAEQERRAVEAASVSAVKDVSVPEDVQGLDELLASTSELNVRGFGLEYVPGRFNAYYREVARFFYGEYDAQEFVDALSESMAALPTE